MRISDWSSDVCSSDLPIGRLVIYAPDAPRDHVSEGAFDGIGIPLARLVKQRGGGGPESMSRHLFLGIAKTAKRCVDRIVADRPRACSYRGEHIFAVTRKPTHTFQNRECLARQWHRMRLAHFHLGCRQRPNCLSEVDFRPFHLAQFAGPLKDMRGQFESMHHRWIAHISLNRTE